MADLAGVRVLVVEDEGLVALMVEEMLEELGCELAASVGNVLQAEEAVRSGVIDIALLDINLAGETTFGFARELIRRPIPFVFSTGYGNAGLPLDLQDRLVLTKPFTPGDLRRAIEHALTATD